MKINIIGTDRNCLNLILIIFLEGLNVAIEDSLGKNVLWLFATHIGIT